MKAFALVLALLAVGCGAAPLSEVQCAALVQRVRDQGDVAVGAIAKARAAETRLGGGNLDPERADYFRAAISGVRSETAALASDVDGALRR